MKTKLIILSLVLGLVSTFSLAQVYTKKQVDDNFVPQSYTITQAQKDKTQDDALNTKEEKGAAYLKADTYSQLQVSDLIKGKMDFEKVSSFALAKTKVTAGKAKQFLIANNELFGTTDNPVPTLTTYDGSNYTHSPALIQNN